MNTIAYYSSDYGFGHAARSVALIRNLLAMEEDVKMIICHSFALHFLRESLKGENRVTFRTIETDIGYVLQKDSIEPDIEKLNAKYKKYVQKWNFLIEQERDFLQTNKVDLVISDISAFPFEAAYTLGIPSLGISNFTWHTAYQGLIASSLLEPLKEAYEKMTYFFSLAGSKEPNWGMKGTKQFGFFARKVDGHEANKIRKLVNPTGEQLIVFFGLGMKIDIEQLERLPIWDSPNCNFIVSSNVQVNRPNVFSIPKDYIESQNYIAAADFVISKPGWGIVSEAVCNRKPLLILDRQTMKEDQNTISFLKAHNLCNTITWDKLRQFVMDETIIKELQSQYKNNDDILDNQADIISYELLQLLKNQRVLKTVTF
jgi:UDP-N-acetylglucosamine transferase subunit ALG13